MLLLQQHGARQLCQFIESSKNSYLKTTETASTHHTRSHLQHKRATTLHPFT